MFKRSLMLLLFAHILNAQEYVAVLEFEGSGMSKIEARNVTDRFSANLQQTRKFKLVERQLLDQILDEQKTQLSGICASDECAVEVGKLANAQYVIAGSVTKTFGLYGISVRLISVETGEIIAHIQENDEADVQQFLSQRVRNAALRMAAEGGGSTSQTSGGGVTVSSGEKGSVVFNLSISGAAVYVDGAYTTQASSQSVSLNLTEGSHDIKFTLAGEKDWIKQLNVLAGETFSYDVKFESGAGSGGIAIDYGIVMVRSEPAGATAYLDGVELGSTPAQNTKVGVGKHLIRVEKTLYHPYAEEITITADGIEQVQADLKPQYGRLLLKSEPTGAVVQLNGQHKGKTPLDLPELASGDYTITVSKDLYYDTDEKFTITDGSNNERIIALHPAFGQLSVEANTKAADVFLDGQFKGKAPVTLNELPSGSYRMKVTQDLYEPLEEEVIIEDGKTNKQMVVLAPRFGTLNITGSPEGALISITGKVVGQIPLVNYRVANGLAEININAKDYHESAQFIQVDVNEMYPINVDLVRHSGTVVAISDPPEALLRLDGKEIGLSPQILKQIPTGQHSLVFAHPSFLEEVREFNLGLDERKEFNIKLVTYEGSLQQEIDKMAWKRNLSLVGSGGFAVGALALKMFSNSAYDDYKTATDSDKAAALFDDANSLNRVAGISLGVAAVALIPAVYFQLDISGFKQRLKPGTTVHFEEKQKAGLKQTKTRIEGAPKNSVMDVDGNIYKTVRIGNQVWMAENLRVTHYRDKSAIPNLTSDRSWKRASSGAYCYYDNKSRNGDTYGALYNWYAATDVRNIAPEGWHVPTDAEWKELEMYLGLSQSEADAEGFRGSNEGSKLAGNADLWNNGVLVSNSAFGASNFTALPGGQRDHNNGQYYNISNCAWFWSSTEYNDDSSWYRDLYYFYSEIGREIPLSKNYGFSVRCVRD